LYEFRFFLNGAYEDVARSGRVNIGPQVELSAIFEGDKIKCTWELKSGRPTPTDWIGFYPVNNLSSQYLSIHYIEQSPSPLVIDAPRIPGDYEFRFVTSSVATAKSNVAVIPNRNKLFIETTKSNDGEIKNIRVTWDVRSVDVSRSDWVALYRKGDENNNYQIYKYAEKVKNELVFDPPQLHGEYEFRYHSRRQSKYKDVARSDTFIIQDKNRLATIVEGPFVKVTWDIVFPKPTSSDWIGFYKEGTRAQNYLAFQYVDLKKNYLLFEKPATQSGNYFVRYFSYSLPKYQPLTESSSLAM